MDYLENELAFETLQAFEGHLSRCPNCRAYLRHYTRAIDAGRRVLAHEDVSATAAGVPEDLVVGILAARRRAQDR
jgi:predicted anti-sigma-YlaC factor YlaD